MTVEGTEAGRLPLKKAPSRKTNLAFGSIDSRSLKLLRLIGILFVTLIGMEKKKGGVSIQGIIRLAVERKRERER